MFQILMVTFNYEDHFLDTIINRLTWILFNYWLIRTPCIWKYLWIKTRISRVYSKISTTNVKPFLEFLVRGDRHAWDQVKICLRLLSVVIAVIS